MIDGSSKTIVPANNSPCDSCETTEENHGTGEPRNLSNQKEEDCESLSTGICSEPW